MQQDLFDRASGRARRTTTIALVLVIVGVLGIIFTIMQHRKAADDVHPFVSLEDSQGKVVTLNLHWVDTNLAEDTKNNRWYHFAQTTDGQDLVLDTGRETHDEINNMMSADPRQEKLKTEPFTYTGYVQSTDSELRPYISERWLAYEDSKDPTLSNTDPRMRYMVTEGKTAPTPWWPYLLIAAGAIGLFMLFAALVTQRSVKRGREEVAAVFPEMTDFTQLETGAQLHIPELNLRIYEPLLISEQGVVVTADLRNAGWMFVQHVRQRYTTGHYLQTHMLDKKVKTMTLPGKKKSIEQQIEPLWDYLAQHHPDIQLGYAKEQRVAYKQRL